MTSISISKFMVGLHCQWVRQVVDMPLISLNLEHYYSTHSFLPVICIVWLECKVTLSINLAFFLQTPLIAMIPHTYFTVLPQKCINAITSVAVVSEMTTGSSISTGYWETFTFWMKKKIEATNQYNLWCIVYKFIMSRILLTQSNPW